ncbi:MAG: hypothetical protein WDZ35_09945 [Crocinitomicaceae bacterium]
MRKTATILLLMLATYGIGQQENPEDSRNKFTDIPVLSKKIEIIEKGVKVGNVSFQYIPNYIYTSGIIFGTPVRLFVDDIEGMSSFEGLSYVLKKTRIIRLSDQDTLIDEPWQFADQGNGYRLAKGEALTYRLPITVGAPMYSGEYLWELHLADITSKKTVHISVKVPVISNPSIQTETKGAATVREAYFFMPQTGMIITNNQIPASLLELRFGGMTGFKLIQGKFNIGMALEIFNEQQESIMKIEDATPNESGIIKPVNGTLNVGGTYRFTSKFVGKKMYLTAQVWDKNGSGSSVIGKTLITVVE